MSKSLTIKEAEKLSKVPVQSLTPLTIEELREMAGKPVYCLDSGDYGIVKYETVGKWANIPFLVVVLHREEVAVNFEWDIEDRGLRCFKLKGF